MALRIQPDLRPRPSRFSGAMAVAAPTHDGEVWETEYVHGGNARYTGLGTGGQTMRYLRGWRTDSVPGRAKVREALGLGAVSDDLRRIGALVQSGASALGLALAGTDGATAADWLGEASHYLATLERLDVFGGVQATEKRRGAGVLRVAVERTAAYVTFRSNREIASGSSGFSQSASAAERSARADAEAAVASAQVTGRHIEGLALDAEAGEVREDDLRRPNAIAAGQAADVEFGATAKAAYAARLEEERMAEQCQTLSPEEWMLAAGRFLPDVGQRALAEQYELTCKKTLPGLPGWLPWWAIPAGLALAYVAVVR